MKIKYSAAKNTHEICREICLEIIELSKVVKVQKKLTLHVICHRQIPAYTKYIYANSCMNGYSRTFEKGEQESVMLDEEGRAKCSHRDIQP